MAWTKSATTRLRNMICRAFGQERVDRGSRAKTRPEWCVEEAQPVPGPFAAAVACVRDDDEGEGPAEEGGRGDERELGRRQLGSRSKRRRDVTMAMTATACPRRVSQSASVLRGRGGEVTYGCPVQARSEERFGHGEWACRTTVAGGKKNRRGRRMVRPVTCPSGSDKRADRLRRWGQKGGACGDHGRVMSILSNGLPPNSLAQSSDPWERGRREERERAREGEGGERSKGMGWE